MRAKKSAGFVVDYYGVARNLREALSAYAEEDIEGTLQSLKDEIPKLRDRHERVLAVFKNVGIDIRTQAGQQEAVDLLEDERIRADFLVKLRLFLTTLDLVLPRPEALPYTEDAKRLGLIQLRARNRYRDDQVLIGKEVGEKVRAGRTEGTYGLDPKLQAPCLGVLRQEIVGDAGMSDEDLSRLALITVELVDHIQSEMKLADFWQSKHNQEVLHNWIVQFLDDQNILPFSRLIHI